MTDYLILGSFNINFVEVTFTARYLFHVRGRDPEEQASSRQTNSARLIEMSGEGARCWLPTCEVTSFVRPIIITY